MRFLFRFFVFRQQYTEKISELEKKIAELEARIESAVQSENQNQPDRPPENQDLPTVLIQQLTVKQIIIEHVDYANNFGQLGIKELTGKLTIGTAYEGDFSKEIEAKVKEKLKSQAKVNLRAKQD